MSVNDSAAMLFVILAVVGAIIVYGMFLLVHAFKECPPLPIMGICGALVLAGACSAVYYALDAVWDGWSVSLLVLAEAVYVAIIWVTNWAHEHPLPTEAKPQMN